jgi:hypothetical protein
MELLPNQTWDTITNQLRQYDRSDLNLKKETANAAMQIICHTCHAVGHKSPDCPQRPKGGKGFYRGGRGYGKGKAVVKTFQEDAVEKETMGENTEEVEVVVVKKGVKANIILTPTTHVPVIFVISQVILRQIVPMLETLPKC